MIPAEWWLFERQHQNLWRGKWDFYVSQKESWVKKEKTENFGLYTLSDSLCDTGQVPDFL
jgi:hypothetical protein